MLLSHTYALRFCEAIETAPKICASGLFCREKNQIFLPWWKKQKLNTKIIIT